jgi:ATP-dependent Clp protease adaptor protein ClpS
MNTAVLSEVEERTHTSLMKNYHVFLHNDDVNDMGHVIQALMQILRLDEQAAITFMLEAHNQGLALVKTEPKEAAEFHQEQLQAASLTSTIEPAE